MPRILQTYGGRSLHLLTLGDKTLCGRSMTKADRMMPVRALDVKHLVTCNKCRNHEVFKKWYSGGQK